MEPRTGYATVGTARLHVRDVGAGPPVVVLHGGPDLDYQYLLPELDRLAGGCRVVYYDQRGRGRSAHGVRPGDVTLESEIDDLEHVRRHFGLESMAILGHSWGGLLALEYASRHPERLTHLVLMNTAPATQEDSSLMREHLARLRPAADADAMRAAADTPAFRAGELDVEADYYRLHYRPTCPDPEVLDRLMPRLRANFSPERVLLARAIEDRLYSQTWGVPGYDVLARLKAHVPTLVLHGAHDFVPIELAAHVTDAIPGARLVVLPGCGHFSYLEDPEQVVRRVGDFLAS